MKKFYYKKEAELEKFPVLSKMGRRHTVSSKADDAVKQAQKARMSKATSVSSIDQLKDFSSGPRPKSRDVTKSLSEDVLRGAYSTTSTVVITETDLSSSMLYKTMKAAIGNKDESLTPRKPAIEAPPPGSLSPVSLKDSKLKPVPVRKVQRPVSCWCYLAILFVVCVCSLGVLATIGSIIYMEIHNSNGSISTSEVPKEILDLIQRMNFDSSKTSDTSEKRQIVNDSEEYNNETKDFENNSEEKSVKTVHILDFGKPLGTELSQYIDKIKTEVKVTEEDSIIKERVLKKIEDSIVGESTEESLVVNAKADNKKLYTEAEVVEGNASAMSDDFVEINTFVDAVTIKSQNTSDFQDELSNFTRNSERDGRRLQSDFGYSTSGSEYTMIETESEIKNNDSDYGMDINDTLELSESVKEFLLNEMNNSSEKSSNEKSVTQNSDRMENLTDESGKKFSTRKINDYSSEKLSNGKLNERFSSLTDKSEEKFMANEINDNSLEESSREIAIHPLENLTYESGKKFPTSEVDNSLEELNGKSNDWLLSLTDESEKKFLANDINGNSLEESSSRKIAISPNDSLQNLTDEMEKKSDMYDINASSIEELQNEKTSRRPNQWLNNLTDESGKESEKYDVNDSTKELPNEKPVIQANQWLENLTDESGKESEKYNINNSVESPNENPIRQLNDWLKNLNDESEESEGQTLSSAVEEIDAESPDMNESENSSESNSIPEEFRSSAGSTDSLPDVDESTETLIELKPIDVKELGPQRNFLSRMGFLPNSVSSESTAKAPMDVKVSLAGAMKHLQGLDVNRFPLTRMRTSKGKPFFKKQPKRVLSKEEEQKRYLQRLRIYFHRNLV